MFNVIHWAILKILICHLSSEIIMIRCNSAIPIFRLHKRNSYWAYFNIYVLSVYIYAHADSSTHLSRNYTLQFAWKYMRNFAVCHGILVSNTSFINTIFSFCILRLYRQVQFYLINTSRILPLGNGGAHAPLRSALSLLPSSSAKPRTLSSIRCREQIVESRRVHDLSGSVKFHVYQALSSDIMQK